jgi:hypothetical protein
MARRKISVGTGILAREVEMSDEPMTHELFDKMFGRHRPTFDDRVVEIEAICQAIVDDQPDRVLSEDEPPALASEILKFIAVVRRELAEGRTDGAARFAVEIGIKWCALVMKLGKEVDWQRGVDVDEGAQRGHAAVHGTKDQKRARWQPIYEDWQVEKAKGTKKAALVVAQRHGVSERQVYRTEYYLSKID